LVNTSTTAPPAVQVHVEDLLGRETRRAARGSGHRGDAIFPIDRQNIHSLFSSFPEVYKPLAGYIKTYILLMHEQTPRELAWIGSARKDFKRFPADVRRYFGYALFQVQCGESDIPGAMPLSSGLLKGLGVVQLVEDFDGDTCRAIYTTTIGTVVAVLHAFKKKSKSGIATPQHEIDLIRKRYRTALRQYADWARGKRDGR
jgi:phage-related protein